MKILLTGGGGAIGRELLPILLKSGHTILSFSRAEINLNHPNLIKLIINFQNINIEGDLIQYSKSPEIQSKIDLELNSIDCILHLAGVPSGEGKDWEDYKEGNIEITRKLVQIAEIKNINKFIFSSSISVYGSSNKSPNIETDDLNGNTYYAKSKIEAEKIILSSNINKTIILRLSSVYGKNLKSFINKLLILNQEGIIPYPILKNNYKSFIYIEDLIKFITISINYENEGIFNISHPQLIEFNDIIKIMEAIQKRRSLKIPLLPIFVTLEYKLKKFFLHKEESSLKPLFYSATVNPYLAIEKFRFFPKYDIYSGILKILE
jgi:GlcNAc-P-P-Und epimerase